MLLSLSKFKVPLKRIQLYVLDARSFTLPVPTMSYPGTTVLPVTSLKVSFSVSVNAAKRLIAVRAIVAVSSVFFHRVVLIENNLIFISVTI